MHGGYSFNLVVVIVVFLGFPDDEFVVVLVVVEVTNLLLDDQMYLASIIFLLIIASSDEKYYNCKYCHVVSYQTLDILFFLLSAQLNCTVRDIKDKTQGKLAENNCAKVDLRIVLCPCETQASFNRSKAAKFPLPFNNVPL